MAKSNGYTYHSTGIDGGHYTYNIPGSRSFFKDPYVYKNGTLKNKLQITSYKRLVQVEREILADKVVTTELVKSSKLDIELLKEIHRYIFGDLFSWAGKLRDVPIEKEEVFFIPARSIQYSEPQNIYNEAKKVIYHLNSVRWNEMNVDEIAKEFSIRIARLWKIHPFRDGNTRAIIGFAKIFAIEHGFPMNMSVFTKILSRPLDDNGNIFGLSLRDMFVGACVEEVPEPEHLIRTVRKAIMSYKK